MKPILFASQSRYKIALFERLGIPFEIAAPPFEEVHDPSVPAAELAQRLARGKAESLGQAYPDYLIIGSDQVLALGHMVLTKPMTTEKAVAQLLSLCGRAHALHSAFTIYDPERDVHTERIVSAHLTFRSGLSPEFLRRIVEADGSHDCVGGYKVESLGILLIEKMETSDPNAITGLPLIAMVDEMMALGYL